MKETERMRKRTGYAIVFAFLALWGISFWSFFCVLLFFFFFYKLLLFSCLSILFTQDGHSDHFPRGKNREKDLSHLSLLAAASLAPTHDDANFYTTAVRWTVHY